jgi:shikimate O-hydroxycinnamoyltransferase
MDGRSAAQFYEIWSRIARDELESIVPPSFDSTPLQARSPPTICFDFPEYTTDQPKKTAITMSSSELSLMRLSKEQIRQLKDRCNRENNATNISTFSAVSALVWKCYCIAQKLAPDTKSKLYFTADVRHRLVPPLKSYFGNAVIRISATSEVSKITSNLIGNVASTVKASTDRLIDEYIRSFIDFVELTWEKKISVTEASESDLRIRTILGTAVTDLDFGCGAMQLLSWERYTENRVIYVMNEPGKDGGIKIVPSLDSSTMEQFKKAFYKELLSCQYAT